MQTRFYKQYSQQWIDREDIATYEEVVKLYPRNELPRPIVLVGPPGVGRNELKRRIMELNPDKYHTPVPREQKTNV